jgi:hypothetical protein
MKRATPPTGSRERGSTSYTSLKCRIWSDSDLWFGLWAQKFRVDVHVRAFLHVLSPAWKQEAVRMSCHGVTKVRMFLRLGYNSNSKNQAYQKSADKVQAQR